MAAPIFPATLVDDNVTIANADGTTAKTIHTAGANGTRIEKLIAVSTDTSARDVSILVNGVSIGTVSVPAGAGNSSGTAAKDILADPNIPGIIDAYGNKVIYVKGSATLQAQMGTTITAAKNVYVSAMGGGF
jgi:hypothetical protein